MAAPAVEPSAEDDAEAVIPLGERPTSPAAGSVQFTLIATTMTKTLRRKCEESPANRLDAERFGMW